MKRALTIIAMGALALAACSDDGGGDAQVIAGTEADDPTTTTPLEPSPEPVATEPTTTISTTTAAPPTTKAPSASNVAVVWHSIVDPERVNQQADSQPTFDADGVTSRIDMFMVVDPAGDNEIAGDCQDEIDQQPRDDDQCLFVQWSFDVADDIGSEEEAIVTAGPLLNSDGRQIESVWATTGVPGAKGVTMSALYAGGEAGSTLRFETGGIDSEWTTHVVDVPPLDAFEPVEFG